MYTKREIKLSSSLCQIYKAKIDNKKRCQVYIYIYIYTKSEMESSSGLCQIYKAKIDDKRRCQVYIYIYKEWDEIVFKCKTMSNIYMYTKSEMKMALKFMSVRSNWAFVISRTSFQWRGLIESLDSSVNSGKRVWKSSLSVQQKAKIEDGGRTLSNNGIVFFLQRLCLFAPTEYPIYTPLTWTRTRTQIRTRTRTRLRVWG